MKTFSEPKLTIIQKEVKDIITASSGTTPTSNPTTRDPDIQMPTISDWD